MKFQIWFNKTRAIVFDDFQIEFTKNNFPNGFICVAIVEAETLEEVFAKTNTHEKLWAKNDGVECVLNYADTANLRSFSIGDVAVRLEEGNNYPTICSSIYWVPLEKPKYTHDCDLCKFLGSYNYSFPDGPHKNVWSFDLYICKKQNINPQKNNLDTFIARFSNEGPDYGSISRQFMEKHVAEHNPKEDNSATTMAIIEAYKRSKL